MTDKTEDKGSATDFNNLRIKGITTIEVMRTAHIQGNHRLALEQAREYARLVKREAEKAEAVIEEAMEVVA